MLNPLVVLNLWWLNYLDGHIVEVMCFSVHTSGSVTT